jgi:hypothetical protein
VCHFIANEKVLTDPFFVKVLPSLRHSEALQHAHSAVLHCQHELVTHQVRQKCALCVFGANAHYFNVVLKCPHTLKIGNRTAGWRAHKWNGPERFRRTSCHACHFVPQLGSGTGVFESGGGECEGIPLSFVFK